MAMGARAINENEPILEMNTTPLIDVLLVLLIMFLVTLPLMTHSTTLQMSGGSQAATKPEVVFIDIDFDGTVAWNGEVVADLGRLENLLRAEADKDAQADLQVRPDGHVAYDTVARVLALAQRSGIERIGVSSAAVD